MRSVVVSSILLWLYILPVKKNALVCWHIVILLKKLANYMKYTTSSAIYDSCILIEKLYNKQILIHVLYTDIPSIDKGNVR